MIRARIVAISCGYEEADDLDSRADPAFEPTGGYPDTGRDLCSTNPVAAGECAFAEGHDPAELSFVDQWMDSYERAPASGTLDIDDTCDVVHGHQQLSLFNARYDER
jgi:hypothetical protein